MKKTASCLLRSCFDLLFWCLCFLAIFGSCHRPVEAVHEPSPDPTLVSIDSLMWESPDSAFALLLDFASPPRSDSLGVFDGHYFQLLVSELLYKNDCEQTNRSALLRSVDYFDSLTGVHGGDASPADVFLDARAHYIKGVGCYERDSVVEACAEYLKAVEVMESRYDEADLTGQKAKFMALNYSHLKNIKRVLIPQAYQEYALTDTQLQQLSLVVNRYYGSFDTLLKQQGLSVTPTMVNLCHLYMLGMDNKQVSILLKMDYSSISRCCKQLQIAFNTQENRTVFLRKILINT